MTDWLDEIEENYADSVEKDCFVSPSTPRMARVLREQGEILGSIYHHWENAGDAPIRHFVGAIEDMSDDAKELLK